VISPKSA